MPPLQPSSSNGTRIMWLAVALAVLTALAYVLITLGILSVGDLKVAADGGVIIYVAAGCYLIGGFLILARRSWLWVIGILINALVILFFFRMYQARPKVVFSAGGIATKAAQMLLEAVLVYLLITRSITHWRKSPEQP